MKTLRRIIFYSILTFGILLIALVASVFLFKDRIINEFISEANKQLNTPVRVGKIDVSVFNHFPRLSIVLNDVYVEDSHFGKNPLLTAKRISFHMNPLDIYRGKYEVKGLKITDSETVLKINDKGVNNYTIVKERKGASNGSISFALNNVELINTKVRYLDLRLEQDMIFTSKTLTASIHMRNDLYTIKATGKLGIGKIKVRDNSFFNGKEFEVTGNLVYDDVNKSLAIKPSGLRLKNAAFKVTGDYQWKDENMIHINTVGENTDIQTLISLFPESVSRKLEKYQSKGDVYFNAQLKGKISKTENPSLTVDFGFSNATLYHPGYRSTIEEAHIEGSFASSDPANPEKAVLVLKNISGKLNKENFRANLVIENFDDPRVICNFKGKVDAASALDFYPMKTLNDVTGSLLVDIDFEGKIAYLENKATAQRVSTLGTVALQDISLTYGNEKIPLQHLKGNLQFSNNDLALSNVSGRLGNSDFLLNGFFKNIVTFVFFENQPIGIEADLQSDFIDLDQIFAMAFGDSSAANDQEYTFSISRNVNLNFNCDVKSLHYKRLHARQLKGDLLVKNQMAVSRNFRLQAMGGELQLSGIVDAQNNKSIDLASTVKLNKLHLDSIFYVFENFRQDFIMDKHLKGQASADINMEMTLNEHLKLFPESLIADIGATLKNGQLNDFEPMQKLNRYLDDEGLSRLRFSDLKNDIHIENKTVYIPQMEVHSNVTDIIISGTHTFDQKIDYRVITPLRKKKVREPEAEMAVEEDARGPRLYLKITGTTDDYRIAYDTEAVKKKIVSDLKKEVRELKDAFKNKGRKRQKEVELEKDDYFDWN